MRAFFSNTYYTCCLFVSACHHCLFANFGYVNHVPGWIIGDVSPEDTFNICETNNTPNAPQLVCNFNQVWQTLTSAKNAAWGPSKDAEDLLTFYRYGICNFLLSDFGTLRYIELFGLTLGEFGFAKCAHVDYKKLDH